MKKIFLKKFHFSSFLMGALIGVVIYNALSQIQPGDSTQTQIQADKQADKIEKNEPHSENVVQAQTQAQSEIQAQTQSQVPLQSETQTQTLAALGSEHELNPENRISRREYLRDPLNRISPDFKVPGNLIHRTSFWFDIYTKYGNNQHVIHHKKFPWLVYDVVDTEPFLKGEGEGSKWQKVQRGLEHVAARKARIRRALRNLSRRIPRSKFSPLEKKLVGVLQSVQGKRTVVYANAISQVRAQLGQKESLKDGIKNSGKYLWQMEKIFQQKGLPIELTRLPFVESSFNERAFSKAGASGLWQLMPKTARSFMEVSKKIDERNSPIKASLAAGKLLKQYHKYFKKWPLTITAYNNGIGNLRKAMRISNRKSLGSIISQYQGKGAFGFASANFYTSFLAALHAEYYHREIFYNEKLLPSTPLRKVAYKLKHSLKPATVAQKTNVNIETLLLFNLDLDTVIKEDLYIPRGYTLMLPFEKISNIQPAVKETYFDPKNRYGDLLSLTQDQDNPLPKTQL